MKVALSTDKRGERNEMNDLHLLNRIEMTALFHWQTVIEVNDEYGWTDGERDGIHHEMDFFIDCVLPKKPTEGWAMWTDGTEILTKSVDIASRMAWVMDSFADGHYHYYDPEEDAKSNEVDDHTGYWYADWD